MIKFKAVTLIEVLLTLAIFTSVSFVAMPIAVSRLNKDRLENHVVDTVSAIHLTQQRAFTGQNDSKFGVAFASGSYTVYEGDSAASSTKKDQYSLPNGFRFSSIQAGDGSSEVVFSQGSLLPSTILTLNATDGRETFSITVNNEGLVDYKQL